MHQFETNKIRHLGKLFAQLFYKDAFAWSVLEVIKLTEEDTTSSSRIFLKQLIQELSDYMGQAKLMERFREDYLQPYLAGLFPKDTPRNMRFAINFFVGIGRGGLA